MGMFFFGGEGSGHKLTRGQETRSSVNRYSL